MMDREARISGPLCFCKNWSYLDCMRTSTELTIFKVRQAVGSMAIEGIRLSAQTQRTMLEIASGEVSASEVKQMLIAQYKQKASA